MARAPLRGALLRLSALAAAALLAAAHRPLADAPTCGAAHSTRDTALPVPDVEISWAVNRVVTCDGPVFWLSTAVPYAGFPLYVGVGVPVVERFAGLRPTVAVVGPGLPAAPAGLPFDVPSGEGAVVMESPEDQSTCGHVENAVMGGASDLDAPRTVAGSAGRCHFYEPWGKSDSWVLADRDFTVPDKATYYVAVWLPGGTTGKFWVSVSDWTLKEDFRSQHPTVGSDCGCAGAVEDFYEQGGRAVPAMEICAAGETEAEALEACAEEGGDAHDHDAHDHDHHSHDHSDEYEAGASAPAPAAAALAAGLLLAAP